MPATLTLQDRVLTLTDEGETSSVDLSGIKGDIGIRGEQGERGTSAVDLSNYYTKEEVEMAIVTSDSHYNTFWDGYQDNGKRTDYNYAFYNVGWTPTTYRPKYAVKPTTASYAYMYSTVENIELIDLSECEGCTATFSTCRNLKEITRCIMGASISTVNNMFRSCENLEKVGFEGVFSKSGLTLQWSDKLTKESILSLFNILADVSGSGGDYVLTIGTTNLAKLTTAEKQIATQKGWDIN